MQTEKDKTKSKNNQQICIRAMKQIHHVTKLLFILMEDNFFLVQNIFPKIRTNFAKNFTVKCNCW